MKGLLRFRVLLWWVMACGALIIGYFLFSSRSPEEGLAGRKKGWEAVVARFIYLISTTPPG